MRILDELGEELVRAARAAEAEPAHAQKVARGRRRPLVRLPRTALISLASLLLLAAAAVAATLVIGRGDPIPPAPAGAVPRELQPVAGTERLSHLDVADPDGGPAWDVRTSRSTTGAICMTVGQLLDGQLGIVGLDRRFRALPTGAADTCSTPQRTGATLASARAYRGAADPGAVGAVHDLTAVAGVAAPAVGRVSVVAGGRRIPVRLAEGGAFLALVPGLPEQLRPRVVLTDRAGRPTTLRFADTGEHLAPDPTGGTPWTLRARSAHAPGLRCITGHREIGPDSPQPFRGYRSSPLMLMLMLNGPSLLPVHCGRRDATAFVTVRRFVPGFRTVNRSFRWGVNPARTVAWGAVGDLHATVSVSVAGSGAAPVRATVDRATHGFLAVLDGRVDPRRVRVTVDGRPVRPGSGVLGTRGQRLAPAAIPAWRSVDSVARRISRRNMPQPVRGTVRTVAHAADPVGGADWLLHAFRAHVTTPLLSNGKPLRYDCLQAGQDAGDGRLSEPLPGGRRRVLTDDTALAACRVGNGPQGLRASISAHVFLDDATRPDARPARVVVWGRLGRGARTATLLGAGAPRKLTIGPQRSVLTVLDGSAAPGPLRLRVSGGQGNERTSVIGLPVSGICHQGVAGTAQVADPDGGLPWIAGLGQVGPPRHRQGCRFVGRLVNGHVATLAADDSNLVYYGTGWSTGIQTGTPGARGVNLQLSTPGGTPFGGPLLTSVAAAQVARRTLPGRTTITGAVAPGVVSVTLRTPRDIRTLRPTRQGLILAVFDGTFYGGEIVATSRFRDGHTVVDRQPARFVG